MTPSWLILRLSTGRPEPVVRIRIRPVHLPAKALDVFRDLVDSGLQLLGLLDPLLCFPLSRCQSLFALGALLVGGVLAGGRVG
jgi:hypothetical protein